jgi:hypothetical protein
VFLEPLIEDLLELWTGVDAYDGITGKIFKLLAIVLWCTHDYLALSTLSGRTTKVYFACIHCDNYPLSNGLRSKIGYFGHFHFVPKEHHLRRNDEFVRLDESNNPLCKFLVKEMLVELERVKDVRPGKPQGFGKRKHSNFKGGHVQIWSQMVSFRSYHIGKS